MPWLAEQRQAGKIRLLGTTNFDTMRLQEIVDAGVSLVSNQLQYSLLDRRVESEMVDFCREQGIHLLSYGSIAGGFLSGRWVGQPEPVGPHANRSLAKYKLIIDGDWIRKILAKGYEYHVWTVDDVETARCFVRWGGMSITKERARCRRAGNETSAIG